jgi:hypothetical protein
MVTNTAKGKVSMLTATVPAHMMERWPTGAAASITSSSPSSHDKQEATVYVLGSDEKSPAPIKTDKVLLTIGDPELMAELLPVPLEGETDGLSSRFRRQA